MMLFDHMKRLGRPAVPAAHDPHARTAARMMAAAVTEALERRQLLSGAWATLPASSLPYLWAGHALGLGAAAHAAPHVRATTAAAAGPAAAAVTLSRTA